MNRSVYQLPTMCVPSPAPIDVTLHPHLSLSLLVSYWYGSDGAQCSNTGDLEEPKAEAELHHPHIYSLPALSTVSYQAKSSNAEGIKCVCNGRLSTQHISKMILSKHEVYINSENDNVHF